MLPGFKEAYDLYRESGWQGLCYPENLGGQGLPMSLALIQSEILAAANWTFLMFPGDHVCNTSPCARTLAAHQSSGRVHPPSTPSSQSPPTQPRLTPRSQTSLCPHLCGKSLPFLVICYHCFSWPPPSGRTHSFYPPPFLASFHIASSHP